MRRELIKAHVKYDDMLGSFAVDFRDPGMLFFKELLQRYNFDFDNYLPYGYGFHLGEAIYKPFDLSRDGYFVVYAVSIEEVGKDEDAIVEAANQNNGQIPTYKFYVRMSAQEFFSLFKRAELILTVFKERLPGEDGFYIDMQGEESLD